MTTLHQLAELGQSIWYDNIRRGILDSGDFRKLLDVGVLGVTSNPSIFQKAIVNSIDYDVDLDALVASGAEALEIYEALVVEDIRLAADMLRPVYDQTSGVDGYVSLEVDPRLAHETAETIAQAHYLFSKVDRPNVMIKVPATPAGIPAVATLIGEGLNINVTLIFSLDQYEAVTEAYLTGLERLAEHTDDLGSVASVASFFVSRVDAKVDEQLEAVGNQALQGKTAIANSKIVYDRFKEIFSSPRWQALAAQGARVQRPLWASTSTKNPAYPDTLYVDALIGSNTVNTVPPQTLDAILDHATVAPTLEQNVEEAREQLEALTAAGIDLKQVTDELLVEGVEAFARSFESLMESIEDKRAALIGKKV